MREAQVESVEAEDTASGVIEQPFDPRKIDITTKQMILEVFFRRLRENAIDMNTFFQRESDLWDSVKQSRLIESILIKLPLPAFYFDGSDDDNWLVVDGLQRLSVFRNYVIEKNFRLHDLEYLTDYNGMGFDDLPRPLQRRIEEHEVTVYIINPGTPDDVKFNLFRRINTGGLVLTPQEIRNALNQGIPVDFIRDLAATPEFKRFLISPKRANDEDFITRFVSFYLHPPSEYIPDLESFMSRCMKELAELSEQERESMKEKFLQAMETAWHIFADDAFRKRYSPGDRRKPMNKSLFEAWSVALASLDRVRAKQLIARKEQVQENFMELLNDDPDFERSITSGTGKVAMVNKRHTEINRIIRQVLGD